MRADPWLFPVALIFRHFLVRCEGEFTDTDVALRRRLRRSMAVDGTVCLSSPSSDRHSNPHIVRGLTVVRTHVYLGAARRMPRG
jgi:hypothetical protein